MRTNDLNATQLIEISFECGTPFTIAATIAVLAVDHYGLPVSFPFNGETYRVNPGDTVDDVWRVFYQHIASYQQ